MGIFEFTITVELDFPEMLDEQERWDMASEIEEARERVFPESVEDFREWVNGIADKYDADVTIKQDS